MTGASEKVGQLVDCEFYDGLTKREYFAGQALAGIMARTDWIRTEAPVAAEFVLHFADALLAALAETNPDK